METSYWVDLLIKKAKRQQVPRKTKNQKRMIADWVRDDCATRKIPPEEVEAELKKHGLIEGEK
jgi:hypothetical protein